MTDEELMAWCDEVSKIYSVSGGPPGRLDVLLREGGDAVSFRLSELLTWYSTIRDAFHELGGEIIFPAD
tara:strand:- start:1881 stop:2087 length:207 start_codon:yes stop_codon:yes gene_type:complete